MGSENDSDTAFDGAVPDGTPGTSAVPATATALPIGIKVVVAGGFGVGKTTFVSTVSEIEPMSTGVRSTRTADTAKAVTGPVHVEGRVHRLAGPVRGLLSARTRPAVRQIGRGGPGSAVDP